MAVITVSVEPDTTSIIGTLTNSPSEMGQSFASDEPIDKREWSDW